MRPFGELNPITVFLYFILTASVAMFCTNPIIAAMSLVGAVTFFIARNKRKGGRSHFVFFVMLIFISLINPLFYHNGATVLLVINNNPITLEALIYGIFTSAMIVSVLYWFRSFSQIMTSDKLLYILGSISPKIALIFSMTLRYIPLFGKQAEKVNQAQKALGLYKDDNIVSSIKGGVRVFSVMVTWALENGIVTADSMTARGYGIKRRTYFSLYRLRKTDIILILVTVVLSAAVFFGIGTGALDFRFYPEISPPIPSLSMYISYFSYAALVLLPTFIEAEEGLKWRLLKSKI